MKTRFFVDNQHFDSVVYKSPQGHVRCNAIVTAAKVLRYYDSEGNKFDILRHPDEVFNDASLATLAGLPMTLGHPNEDGKNVLVTPGNWKKYAVGVLGDSIQTINPFVKINGCSIHSDEALEALQTSNKQISPGYEATLIEESGTFDSIPYTHRQIGINDGTGVITYNHVAIMRPGENGRNGSDVRLLVDSGYDFADIKPVIIDLKPKKKHMKSVFFDVKDFKNPNKSIVQGVYVVDEGGMVMMPQSDFNTVVELNSMQYSVLMNSYNTLSSLGFDSTEALADSYKETLAAKKALEVALAEKPEVVTDSEDIIQQKVLERVALIDQVKPFLDSDLSKLSDVEIKKELIKKFNASLVTDSMESVSINGAYPIALAALKERNEGVKKQASIVTDSSETVVTDSQEKPSIDTVRSNLRSMRTRKRA